MKIWDRFRARLQRNSDLEEEIQSYLAMANRDRTSSPSELRREFGDVVLVKEATREMWGWNWLERILQDLRHSARALRKGPGFSLTAILVLGLGIGLTATVFSIVNAVFLRPLPFPDAGAIVNVRRRTSWGSSPSFSIRDFITLRQQQRVLSALAISELGAGSYNLLGPDGPERVSGLQVSAQFFAVFGVQPVAGRLFSANDDAPGRPHLAVLSEGLWRRRFGGNSSAVGQPLTLSGIGYTIAGVAPDTLHLLMPSDIYVLLPIPQESADRTNGHMVFGRIKAGMNRARAGSELDAIAKRDAKTSLLTNMAGGLVLASLQDALTRRLKPALEVLFAAVLLVLLVTCSNVANLVLARGAARSREIAAMAALGAPRPRIITRLLAESLLLAGAGGVLGLLLAALGIRLVPVLAAGYLDQTASVRMDPWVVAFAILAAGLSGVAAGIIPAMQLSRVNLTDALRQGTAQGGGGKGRTRLRGLLVASQIALSTTLLVGAVLLVRSFWKLTGVDTGFRPDHLLTMTISPDPARYPDSARTAEYYARVAGNIEHLPGVEAASSTSVLPSETDFDFPVTPIGGKPLRQNASGDSDLDAQFRAINPHYFAAMGIPVLRGRTFSDRDTANSAPVVLVNASLAHAAFGEEDALGRALIIGKGYLTSPLDLRPRTIVGIAGDTRELGLARGTQMTAYVPAGQSPDQITRIALDQLPPRWVIRTRGAPLAMAGRCAERCWMPIRRSRPPIFEAWSRFFQHP